jgi:hypothetical protein
MGIQEDLTDAVETGRDEIVRVLAAHRVVPVVVEQSERGSSNLLGGSTTPDFSFERQHDDGSERVADRQTRTRVVDALGLTSEEACTEVREEIEDHDDWGATA